MLSRMLVRTYITFRRVVRAAVVRNPHVERLLGPYLVALEGFLPLHKLVRFAPNPIVYDGHKIFYRSEDVGVILPLLFHGTYEPETTSWLKEFLKPGMTLVDCGAHIGYFTLLGARAVAPWGKVYAFEPEPSTVEVLKQNVICNGYGEVVEIIPKAVWSRAHRVRLFVDKRSSVSAKVFPHEPGQWHVEVDATSLDDFFRGKGWPPVHVVKMDIEGAETAACEGMKELSLRNPGLKLIVEVNFQNLVGTGVTLKELFGSIQACGFSRFRLLWRRGSDLELPREMSRLEALARVVNVNLLCEKE